MLEIIFSHHIFKYLLLVILTFPSWLKLGQNKGMWFEQFKSMLRFQMNSQGWKSSIAKCKKKTFKILKCTHFWNEVLECPKSLDQNKRPTCVQIECCLEHWKGLKECCYKLGLHCPPKINYCINYNHLKV